MIRIAFLLLVLLRAPLYAESIFHGPYLQDAQPSSVLITWETDEAAPSRIDVKLSAGWKSYRSSALRTHHTVRVTKLSPATAYRYRVFRNGNEVAASSSFRTAPKRDASIRFAALGDSGSGGSSQRAVSQQLFKWAPHLVLHTGDIIYPSGEWEHYLARFFAPFANWLPRIPIYPSLGNHDALNDGFSRIFDPPARRARSFTENYYSFDYGMAHFIALNTNEDYLPGSVQYEWLVRDLRSSIKRGARWKIVFFHHPPFGRGRRGATVEVQTNLIPVFEKYRVDLVLSGHDHAYERTGLLNRTGAGGKVLYIVTGGGGVSLSDAETESPEIRVFQKAYHFVGFEVSESKLRGTAIDLSGNILDRFTLRK